jgi:hypothetical protein
MRFGRVARAHLSKELAMEDVTRRDPSFDLEMALATALLLLDGDMLAALRSARELNHDGSVPGALGKGDPTRSGFYLLKQISDEWHGGGCPRFVLSASVASLLVSTKAPEVTEEAFKTPYDVMVVEVPGEWTSMHGVGPLHVLMARIIVGERKGLLVAACRRFIRPERLTYDEQLSRSWDETPDVVTRVALGDASLADDGYAGRYSEILQRSSPPYFTEAVRYLVNTSCLVTAHTECAIKRVGKNTRAEEAIHDVRPPQDVEVTAEFRRYAQNLVANRKIQQKKQALLHLVRGHWKRQASGPERQERALIWIKPYQRGADSLGRIVSKEIALTARSI